ncbi:hypothetical protein [Fuchsiella alkaliacetigena]|uniref:hypothetical protein n=1 Tax=Fuchsiella alkaliacetigena TaxID=957042 RepID=UPI00200AC808|nr:hypothetical protein [Fuchsiella alkaliacetigena]MCK8825538.1 hypothetical protein [Fuchsiella alkaliacetigena]
MKKSCFIFLITFITINLICLGTVKSAEVNEYVVGRGQAVLGSGITLEKAEEIALSMAKREAIESFGVYVKSEQIVKNYQLVEDKITTISAGIVELKPDSKEVNTVMSGDIIKVKVEATFIINRKEFERRLNQYLDNRDSGDINQLIEKINQLEKKIAEHSQDDEASLEEVESSLVEIKESYQKLDDAFYFPGQRIVTDIQDQRIARLKKVREYLEELKTVANPYQFFSFEIEEEIEVEVKGLGKVEITIPKTTTLSRSYYQRARDILGEYQEYIYEPVDLDELDTSQENPLNDRLEEINKKALGKSKVIKAPLLIAFLNKDDEVIAFYRSEQDRYFNFYIHEESTAKHYVPVSLTDFDIHWFYATDSGLVKIQKQWKGQLPEEIISEVESIRPIFSKYEIAELKTEYDYKAHEELSFIHSSLPVRLSEIKLKQRDIVEVINKQIDNIEAKIAKLEGDVELEGGYEHGDLAGIYNYRENDQAEQTGKEDIKEADKRSLRISYSPLSLTGKANEDLALAYTDYQDLSQGYMISVSLAREEFLTELIEGLLFIRPNEFTLNYYKLNEYIKGYGLNIGYLSEFDNIGFDLLEDNFTLYYGLGGGLNYFIQESENDETLAKINRTDDYIRAWGFNLATKLGLKFRLSDWIIFSELNVNKLSISDWYYRESSISDSRGDSVEVSEKYLPYPDVSIDNPIWRFGVEMEF